MTVSKLQRTEADILNLMSALKSVEDRIHKAIEQAGRIREELQHLEIQKHRLMKDDSE